MENNQQYLRPEAYVGIIQELSTTIANMHIDLALAKAQYKELADYAQKMEEKLQPTESVEKVDAEIVGE